jgi:hypothetical protein
VKVVSLVWRRCSLPVRDASAAEGFIPASLATRLSIATPWPKSPPSRMKLDSPIDKVSLICPPRQTWYNGSFDAIDWHIISLRGDL